jgi:hypothetical protein
MGQQQQRYVREFTAVQVMGAQRAALGLTQRQVLAEVKRRYRLETSRASVNRILCGEMPLHRAALASPDVLAGILMVLEIQDLQEVGLRPEDAPIVHAILEGHRRGAIPPPATEGATIGGYSPPAARLDRVA